jgi:hypothetical protein
VSTVSLEMGGRGQAGELRKVSGRRAGVGVLEKAGWGQRLRPGAKAGARQVDKTGIWAYL